MKKRTREFFLAASRNARRAPGYRNEAQERPEWLRVCQGEGAGEGGGGGAGGREATIHIYGVITPFAWWDDEVSAKDVLNELEGIEAETIHVRIKSEGGSVFDGVAIYNLLREHDARVVVHVDSLAASIASVIAMAGDEIVISEAASMMIHKPSTVIWGNAEELRHEAGILDTIEEQIVAVYKRRTGNSGKTLAGWLEEETWMSGAQAVENGFADRLAEDGEQPTEEEEQEDAVNGGERNLAGDPPRESSSVRKGDEKEKAGPGAQVRVARARLELLQLNQ